MHQFHIFKHLPLYHENVVEKVVVGEHTHRRVERILTIACRDHTRAVVLASDSSASESLFPFRLDPATHFVIEPTKFVKFEVSFVCCEYFRCNKAVEQRLCMCGE